MFLLRFHSCTLKTGAFRRLQFFFQNDTTFMAIMVVYDLPQKSGNFGWNVNGKPILVFPNGKFPEKTGFPER